MTSFFQTPAFLPLKYNFIETLVKLRGTNSLTNSPKTKYIAQLLLYVEIKPFYSGEFLG